MVFAFNLKCFFLWLRLPWNIKKKFGQYVFKTWTNIVERLLRTLFAFADESSKPTEIQKGLKKTCVFGFTVNVIYDRLLIVLRQEQYRAYRLNISMVHVTEDFQNLTRNLEFGFFYKPFDFFWKTYDTVETTHITHPV